MAAPEVRERDRSTIDLVISGESFTVDKLAVDSVQCANALEQLRRDGDLGRGFNIYYLPTSCYPEDNELAYISHYENQYKIGFCISDDINIEHWSQLVSQDQLIRVLSRIVELC